MSQPQRIQLSRRKGFSLQETSKALNGLPAVKCARPGKWGNPFKVGEVSEFGDVPDAATAVMFYRAWIDKGLRRIAMFTELRGKNLACFCALDQPCHVDVLLEIANP